MPLIDLSLPQCIGYFAFILTVIAFWQKNDRRLIAINAMAAFCWIFHFGLLGSYTGSYTEALVFIRSGFALAKQTPKQKQFTSWIFIALFIIGGALTLKYWYDALSVIACILGTISVIHWQKFVLRYGLLASLTFWLAYNVVAGSIGGSLSGAFLIITQVVTLLRMYRDQHLKQVAA